MSRAPYRRPMADLVPRFREDHVGIVRSFIAHVVEESGRRGVVLGLSGGLDSALVAKLCADAIGPKRVLGMALPEGPGGQDRKDAEAWAKELGIGFRVLDIKRIVGTFERSLVASRAPRIARGNIRARARMIVLYYVANTEGRLVIGTGNKSEILTGYFTVAGAGCRCGSFSISQARLKRAMAMSSFSPPGMFPPRGGAPILLFS